MRTILYTFLLCVCLMGTSCSQKPAQVDQAPPLPSGSFVPTPQSHLKYFGYVGVDCFLDDPHDATGKTNYADEIGSFSNIAHVCVYSPNDDLSSRLAILKANGLRAILDLHFLFYQINPSAPVGASGKNYDLYPDYLERWNQFLNLNRNVLTEEYIQAFYPADEPSWVGIAFSELDPIVVLLKSALPNINIALVEASQSISSLIVPAQVDWVGMNRYGTANVTIDPVWLAAHNAIKAKRSAPHQKVLIVMDAQWVPLFGEAGYPPSAMEAVNRYYFEMAQSDPDVIGIIGYSWAGGIGSATHFGMRNLPSNVIDENKRMGRIITGK